MLKKHKKLPKRPDRSVHKSVIRVDEQIINGSVFADVAPANQYALLLLGHIFHEISWLQRMLYIGQKNIDAASQIEKDGQALQLMFLVRLMLGKLIEFDTLLRDERKIDSFLAANFAPESPADGRAAIDSVRTLFASNDWIRKARNKHFNHYPVFNDVKTALSHVNEEWDFRVYYGERSTHTLYATADAFANLAWLNLADAEDPARGLNNGLEVLLSIAGEALVMIELALGHYLRGPLAREGDTKQIALAVRPLSEQRFDFFSDLEEEKPQSRSD